jgi:glucose/arabinose dehydrogenase
MRPSLAFAPVLLLAGLAGAARAGTPAPGFTDDAYVSGLSSPTAIAFLPDGRLLIAEKGGFGGPAAAALKLFDGTSTTTLATIPVCTDSEMGLLGVAVDPSFASNGFIYLYRSAAGAGGCATSSGRFNQVVRVTMAGSSIVPNSLTVLLDGIRTDDGNHDGGVLRIGPDGLLYVGVGDTGLGDNQGGPGSSTNPYAQDLSSLNGKILRLNLDGSVPPDNPFVGTPGARGEIFAYGFRNPFRMSFDGATGKLWVGDVGDETVEEIDIVHAGGNYAWPHCEGTLPHGCEQPGDVDPIFTYLHSGSASLGECVIGGAFAGSAFGALAGDYVFGDCVSSIVYHVAPNPARDGLAGTPQVAATAAGTPADFVAGPDGAIYYTSVGNGEVRRLAAAPAGGDQPLGGKKLALHAGSSPARATLTVVSANSPVALGGPGDDPTVAGGSLRVRGATFDVTYPLPAANWSLLGKAGQGKGFKYKDAALSAGPVKTAQVKTGTLVRASAKGAGLVQPLAGDPSPVDVVLTIGARRYCMEFGGTSTFKPGKVLTAKQAPAPAACP